VNADDGFLSRWSRRKEQARQGVAPQEPVPREPGPAPAKPAAIAPAPANPSLPAQSVDTAAIAAPPEPAPPTMADVATLTRESDFSRLVAPGVDGNVRNAALKTLFGDPRFNVMDGLDVYIDDYSRPDPLPLASIRQMAQAAFLGLVQAEPVAADPARSPPSPAPESTEVAAADAAGIATPEPDENADLRLQPHDAAGCGGAEDSAAADGPRRI